MQPLWYQTVLAALSAVELLLFGLASTLSLMRYHVRWQQNRRLFLDDGFHILAWVFCLAFCVCNILLVNTNSDQDPSDDQRRFFLGAVQNTLFWASIFTSKSVFIILYYNVFGVSKKFMIAWWMTCISVLAAFIIVVVAYFMQCNSSPTSFSFHVCVRFNAEADPAIRQRVMRRAALLSLVPNIVTDILLVILPLCMILRLNMSTNRKWRGASIVLLTLFTIAFDVIHWTFFGLTTGLNPTSVGIVTEFVASAEPIVSFVVAALPPLLFNRLDQEHPVPTTVATPADMVNQSVQRPQPARSQLGWRHQESFFFAQPTSRIELEIAVDSGEDLITPSRYLNVTRQSMRQGTA